MSLPFISVVIPAFNEETNIGDILQKIHLVLKSMGFSYEIIVVDDGSADDTSKIASKYDIVLVRHDGNLGKGVALKSGFSKSNGNFIVTIDADGSHRPEDLPKLFYPFFKFNNIDVVIGSRFSFDIGKNSTKGIHLIGNRIINFLILLCTGKYISDSQSGFRIYKKRCLETLTLNSSRYDIESEITIKLLKKRFMIVEVPVVCLPRKNGYSGISTFKDGLINIKTIIKMAFHSLID